MTSETQREHPIPADPRLLPYFPLIYVAWADGELSDAEISHICQLIGEAPGLDLDCRRELGGWLDPASPPTARELAKLLGALRRESRALDPTRRRSLAELGVELAHLGGRVVTEEELAALGRVESALGVSGVEAARVIAPSTTSAKAVPEPSFDAETLGRLLDGHHHQLRADLRSLLASEPFDRSGDPPSRDAHRELVLGWCHELAARGYGALAYPEAYGGRDDLAAMVAAFETIAFHDLSLVVKFGVQFGLFAGSIHQLGSDWHHEQFLGPANRLELPGCFAMTETGHGSNVQELETTAAFDRSRQVWVIHTPHRGAGKDYIGNAALHGRLATVFAQLEIDGEGYGVHAFLVPIRSEDGEVLPGVTIEDCGHKEGLNGVDNGRIWFDRVEVPREHLLDRFATVSPDGEYDSPIRSPGRRFFTMLGTLVGGRVSIAHAAASVSKTALTIALRYAEERRQFGPAGLPEVPLMDYPTHRRRLMPRLAATIAHEFALQELARQFATAGEGDRRELEALAAGLKAQTTWHAIDTVQTCRECCGGQGYLWSNRFAELKADCDVFATFEGDNVVLLQLVTKGLLADLRRQFNEMSFVGMTRFVAAKAATVVAELNPIITRRTDPEHLDAADVQLAALRWREEHLLTTIAQAMRKAIAGGSETFEAFLANQISAVDLGRAHVERVVLERFVSSVGEIEDSDLRRVLDRVRTLYGLACLERDRAWFLEHHYVEPPKAKAIVARVDHWCTELRPDVPGLLDAFRIPDALLRAPIAT